MCQIELGDSEEFGQEAKTSRSGRHSILLKRLHPQYIDSIQKYDVEDVEDVLHNENNGPEIKINNLSNEPVGQISTDNRNNEASEETTAEKLQRIEAKNMKQNSVIKNKVKSLKYDIIAKFNKENLNEDAWV